MMNIYYLAKRNEASSAIADLNKLLLHHNLTKFNSIQKGSKLMYEHHESVREMQNAMAKVVQDDLLDDIKNSAVYSIIADESTDVSTEKTLMLYVRYIKNGAPKVSFLEVVELAGDECNSENICNTILRVLEQRNLCVTNLSCITTDGASVMTGCRSGVTTLMKEKNCQLLSIHCIAHRLALASGQAADNIPYLKKYQHMVNTIYKYFKYSPKHLGKLKKMQSVLEMSEIKFKQTFATRWLSFEGAVDAIITNYDALVMCLEQEVAEDDDHTARGLLIFITDYLFLATSYFLSDVLTHLSTLSKIFQKSELDIGSFALSTSSTLASITQLENSDGLSEREFKCKLPSNFTQGFEFGPSKHHIKCSDANVDRFIKARNDYLRVLLGNLKARFQDNQIIQCFSVLTPSSLPESLEDFFVYGNDEIRKLGDLYSNDKQKTSKLGIDKKTLCAEWPMFKHTMQTKFSQCKFSEMAKLFLNDRSLSEISPNIGKLVKIALSLPVSSADCERGFAKYNLVKTELKNKLQVESVNVLMKITVDTPGIDQMDSFDFKRAFDIWLKQKERRFMKQIKCI
ncbi:hypothetical protein FSP39_023354 [Pinctada imbricata]|uniref:HAT C-terminal dimerisation domain-containing protein n=1 Tax=Pinctada imbricata TaxID=66713 RepID=A0AA88Y9B0_PINIB|nr:hypothetical protein FSP39_023354 [Pinctada imbricata]